MYALCDVNSMYASCEKVFNPSIRNKPVVVLTNNDGCICAACGIAKRMGIGKKFVPYCSFSPFAEIQIDKKQTLRAVFFAIRENLFLIFIETRKGCRNLLGFGNS